MRTKCKICGTENPPCFSAQLMGAHEVAYFHCASCGFVQTEEPYWLQEAYAQPINASDTGHLARNLFYAARLTVLLFLLFGKNGRFLDYAGGYGVLVRLMRDVGFDYFWSDRYTQNLFATGFEWNRDVPVQAVTLFEVVEHLPEPMREMESLLTICRTVIFSTELHPDPLPPPQQWWYYGLEHGQHIAFYSELTLQTIARKFNLNYYRVGSLHIMTDQRIPTWKLASVRLTRLGLHRIIGALLKSKTDADHLRIAKMRRP